MISRGVFALSATNPPDRILVEKQRLMPRGGETPLGALHWAVNSQMFVTFVETCNGAREA